MRSALRQLGLAAALAFWTVGAAWADGGDEPRAQMLTLRYEFGAGQRQFLANGVPLTAPAPAPGLHANEKGSGWGANAGTVILALGVALALIVVVAGNEAEDLKESNDDDCVPGTPGC